MKNERMTSRRKGSAAKKDFGGNPQHFQELKLSQQFH
jgi:hypothetical protein